MAKSWPDIDASIAATSQSFTLVAANLLTKQPSQLWRSTSAADQTLSGSFTADRVVDTFALWNFNLTVAATLTLELYDGVTLLYTETWDAVDPIYGWGEQPWDLGPWGGYADETAWTVPFAVRRIAAPVVCDNWKLIISDSANPDGYMQAGRFMLGLAWSPGANFDWGVTIGWHDPTDLVEMESGALSSEDEREPVRVGEMTWQWLDENDARGFNEITRSIGRRNTVVVVPFPEESTSLAIEQTILARLEEWQQPQKLQTKYYATAVRFREVI